MSSGAHEGQAWKWNSKKAAFNLQGITDNITFRDPTEIAEVFSDYYREFSDSNSIRMVMVVFQIKLRIIS